MSCNTITGNQNSFLNKHNRQLAINTDNKRKRSVRGLFKYRKLNRPHRKG